MPGTSPVILIFGAGPNIGHHVARAFASKGYKIALAARRLKESDNTPDQINVPTDLTDPNSVITAFSKTKALLGVPSVVIYNGAASVLHDTKNPLSAPLDSFTRDLTVNVTSTFVAAQQAVLGFEQLPETASRTFIFTGNILNEVAMMKLLDLGVGKSAAAHIIQASAGFTKIVDINERKADGSAKFAVDGEAHGKLYLALAEGKSQGPWQQTFVKDVGYKQFPRA